MPEPPSTPTLLPSPTVIAVLALAPLITSVPPLIAVAPVYTSRPFSVSDPEPVLVRPTLPARTESIVAEVEAAAKLTEPAVRASVPPEST